MTREEVADAIAALEAAGTPVTTRNIHHHLGKGSMRDVQRHWRAIQHERGAPAVMESATALEPPSVPDSGPGTLQAITDAETAFEAAKAHVEALKQQHAPALRQHGILYGLWQSRAITRQDPAWKDFDAACAQIKAAEEAVARAEQDLTSARQAHERHCYELAAAEVAQTPDGRELLAKIDEYQQLYEEAVRDRSQKTMSWLMSRDWAKNRFKDMVHIHQGLVQPKTPITAEQEQQGRVSVVERMQQENPARESARYNVFR